MFASMSLLSSVNFSLILPLKPIAGSTSDPVENIKMLARETPVWPSA